MQVEIVAGRVHKQRLFGFFNQIARAAAKVPGAADQGVVNVVAACNNADRPENTLVYVAKTALAIRDLRITAERAVGKVHGPAGCLDTVGDIKHETVRHRDIAAVIQADRFVPSIVDDAILNHRMRTVAVVDYVVAAVREDASPNGLRNRRHLIQMEHVSVYVVLFRSPSDPREPTVLYEDCVVIPPYEFAADPHAREQTTRDRVRSAALREYYLSGRIREHAIGKRQRVSSAFRQVEHRWARMEFDRTVPGTREKHVRERR